jgi:Txe/YoeB family toxin of Txe-Axe toxin-antitoxin module
VSCTILFTNQAQKDARKLASASPALKQRAQALLELLASDPYAQPPAYESDVGDLRGACSRRIFRPTPGLPRSDQPAAAGAMMMGARWFSDPNPSLR